MAGSEPAPAERLILALVRDLFFRVKLGNELKSQSFRLLYARDTDEFARLLAETKPALGLIDLNAGVDWERVAMLGQAAETAAVPLLVFGPHKDIAGRRAAKAAGVARVLSNSQFHAEAPLLIAR